jgi:hypothetical protein
MAPTTPPAYRIRLAQLGLSGAAYAFIALFVNQGLADASLGSRLLTDPEMPAPLAALLFMGIVTVPLTFLLAWGFCKATGRRHWRTWSLTWRWALGVFGLWVVAMAMGDVGLLVFLPYWAAFAWLLTPRKALTVQAAQPKPDAPKAAAPRRQSRGAMRGSFGRIPKESEVLLKELVRQVTVSIVAAVPAAAPPAVRRATVRIVLDAVLTTWWSDGRAEPLDSIDVERLKSAVGCAAELTDNRFDTVSQGVYRGALRGLVNGWRLRRF